MDRLDEIKARAKKATPGPLYGKDYYIIKYEDVPSLLSCIAKLAEAEAEKAKEKSERWRER